MAAVFSNIFVVFLSDSSPLLDRQEESRTVIDCHRSIDVEVPRGRDRKWTGIPKEANFKVSFLVCYDKAPVMLFFADRLTRHGLWITVLAPFFSVCDHFFSSFHQRLYSILFPSSKLLMWAPRVSMPFDICKMFSLHNCWPLGTHGDSESPAQLHKNERDRI